MLPDLKGEKMFTSHIRENDGTVQSVKEHSINTAYLAKGFLESVGLPSSGMLAGLLHDAGKLTERFDNYIRGLSDEKRGEIDHSYTGAKYLYEAIQKSSSQIETAAATLIAHTIISHHAIHDWLDDSDENYFEKRISKTDGYAEATANLREMLSEEALEDLLMNAAEEIKSVIIKTKTSDSSETAFYIGMLERLIQSALIDADRTDTSDFMAGRKTEIDTDDNRSLWNKMDERLNSTLKGFESLADPISQRRKMISDRCAAFAEHKVGACRLIVPTGGGKTLSSIRFAIKQSERFNMERIIYIAPFMSILEQNSDVIGKIAGEENFLEHHSNILAEIDDENEYNDHQLHTERWDKPVIATTMVQFFNSLFSSNTSSVRRMHRLCHSVIIIDEVQSVPIKCVYMFSLAINFLTRVCGCSVVLCSATQPTFEKNVHRLILDEQSDMIPEYHDDFDFFKRTEVINAVTKYGYDLSEAAKFAYDKFIENGDLLFVVNTKSEAAELYRLLKGSADGEAEIIHLSTNMCPAHRKEKIKKIRDILKMRKPVICITTQLIEAGVDISFRCVIRALAGMDNAAQAAGRCNRNGENKDLCPVYLINLKNEKLGSLDEIKNAQTVSYQIMQNTSNDLLSADIQNKFFEKLYDMYTDRMSYPIEENKPSLLELLSLNKEKYGACKNKKPEKYMAQSFKTAGKLFEVIDSNTQNVLVPYNKEAEDIIAKLRSDTSGEEIRRLLRKAQRYTVGIYQGTEKKLNESNALYICSCNIKILEKEYYDSEFGVITEGAERELLMF